LTEVTQEQWQLIENELAGGRKIAAIKLYRELTGVGLKEAKDAVEAHVAELVSRDPQRYASLKSQKQGCMPALLLLLIPITIACVSPWS
jgi:ribosomal protein L7/L12